MALVFIAVYIESTCVCPARVVTCRSNPRACVLLVLSLADRIHVRVPCSCCHLQTLVWEVPASPPRVSVPVRPAALSGSSRPLFVFAVDWADSAVGRSAPVQFQVLLLGDTDLGAFRVPAVCNGSLAGFSTQRDCVAQGCAADGCNYTLALEQGKGASVARALQVGKLRSCSCCLYTTPSELALPLFRVKRSSFQHIVCLRVIMSRALGRRAL